MPPKIARARARYIWVHAVVDAEFKSRIHEVARSLDLSESDAVRAALRAFIERHGRAPTERRRRGPQFPRRRVSL